MDAKTKVDTGEELYLLKENIKPLQNSRMICQLRTALLAQDDEAAHHELLKRREKYEMLLRSYEGSDRLELWYEYILWVEQSFLGDSREGNLYVLLERCLACLAEDEGYLQDRRYIELWIKYIELSINPLEVYKQCHAHGIGKHCAFFYMSWAFEFEKTGDFKRADQVFSEGFKNSSQAIDELEEAHKNFRLRVARQVLSGSSDVEAACIEQRVALSKLKANGHKKNVVGSVRVGSDLQRGSAGVLQPITQHGSNSSNVQTNPIEVSSGQEDDTSAEFSVLRRVHLSSIPRREILNKENLLEPGLWNGKMRNNRKVAVLSRPQQPSFELYRDDEVRVEYSPLVICNALKPRKLDDDEEFKCAIALFEPEDPSKRPLYCKNKVYAGVTEFSFEELRAIEYLKGNRPARCKTVYRDDEVRVENSPLVICNALKPRKLDDDEEFKCAIALFEPEDASKRPLYCKNKVYVGMTEFSFEELRAIEYLKGNRPARCKQGRPGTKGDLTAAKLYGEEMQEIKVIEVVECEKRNTSLPLMQATEKQNFNLCVDVKDEEDDGFGAVPHGDTENIAPELFLFEKLRRVDEVVVKTVASEVLPKLSNSEPSHMTDSSSYCAKMSNKSYDQSFCHQSLTYNTKEVMKMMHELWTTPEDKKLQFNTYHVDGSESKKKTLPFENVDTQCLQAELSRLSFEIFKDESVVHGQGENGASCAPQPARRADHYKISRDEIEGMGQMQKGSGSLLDPAQEGLVLRDSIQTLSSVKRDIKMSVKIEASNENCPSSYFEEDNIAPYSANDELQCPRICTSNTYHVDGSESKKKTLPFENVDTQCLQAELSRLSFEIFKDESVVHGQGENGASCAPQPARRADHYKISRDEIEGMGQMQKGSGSLLDPAQEGLVLRDSIQTLSSVKRDIKMSEQIEASNENCPSSYFEEDNIAPYSANDELQCPRICTWSIPFVPSPGMTEEAEKAQIGTEMKENVSPEGILVSQIEKRKITGILQPSTDFPCDPKEDTSLQGEFLEPETYYSNVTCNTQVFSCPLLSSTPLVGQLKQPSDRNAADASANTWYCHSDEVSAHMSAGSSAHIVPNLSTILETVEPRKSSSSSGSSGTTHHTATSLQENCTGGNMKRNENVHKSNGNSGHDRGITKAWKGCCNVQEGYRQIEHYSINRPIVKMTAESFHCKMETVCLPEEPNPSQNICLEGSVHSVLQEESNSLEKQTEILRCQQIRGRNSRAGDFSEFNFEGLKVNDPFDLPLIQKLLAHVGFSNGEYSNCYVKVSVQMPRFKIGGTVTLGRDKFTIEKILGQGSYAKVFKGIDMGTQKTVALKIQKPSWEWELYICHQLQSRLSDPLSAMAFMDIHKAYILTNGSVMVTDYSKYGSLLSVLVKLRQNREPVPEDLMLYWMTELLSIAEKMQQCRIIHGDIKPDNFVLRTLPSLHSKEPSLQLIDMGRGIDMTFFPEGTTFNTVVNTKDFQCIEMQTKQPWTYQIDLYGIAGTMHCVYFNEYMKVCKESDGRWFIRQSILRYSKQHLWEQFFYTLLNVESCDKLPDVSELRRLVEGEILRNKHFCDLTRVRNVLDGK